MTTHPEQAARVLSEMLTRPGPYRRRWAQVARRASGRLSQAAVAHVLSLHLWETGEHDESDLELPRRLKDRVSRALGGRLSTSMLRTFVEAFEMSDRDAEELWNAYFGLSAPGLLVVRPHAAAAQQPAPPRSYQTVLLQELHTVGQDRIPVSHRTNQGLLATGPLSTYRFRFDTSAAVVSVVRGGAADAVRATEQPGVYAVDIELEQPLTEPGQTASLEYDTYFTYPEVPEPIFRRVCLRRTENVELGVRFHPASLPREVRWCVWSSEHPWPLEHSEVVTLGPAHSVHRFVRVIENSGVGFTWTW